MQSKLKVLQVIPKLGYGGAETGCYDIAHYLPENNVGSYFSIEFLFSTFSHHRKSKNCEYEG